MLFYDSLSINDNFFNLFITLYNGDSDYQHITQAEGLPELKASIECESDGLFNGRGTITCTGGFSVSKDTKYAGGYDKDSNRPRHLDFIASASEIKADGTFQNDVFGKSDHLTPYNSAIQIWKRIS